MSGGAGKGRSDSGHGVARQLGVQQAAAACSLCAHPHSPPTQHSSYCQTGLIRSAVQSESEQLPSPAPPAHGQCWGLRGSLLCPSTRRRRRRRGCWRRWRSCPTPAARQTCSTCRPRPAASEGTGVGAEGGGLSCGVVGGAETRGSSSRQQQAEQRAAAGRRLNNLLPLSHRYTHKQQVAPEPGAAPELSPKQPLSSAPSSP